MSTRWGSWGLEWCGGGGASHAQTRFNHPSNSPRTFPSSPPIPISLSGALPVGVSTDFVSVPFEAPALDGPDFDGLFDGLFLAMRILPVFGRLRRQ